MILKVIKIAKIDITPTIVSRLLKVGCKGPTRTIKAKPKVVSIPHQKYKKGC